MLLIIDSKGGFAAEVAPYAEELQVIFARTPDRVTPSLPYYSEIENIIVPHTNMVDTLVAQGVDDKTIIPLNYRQANVSDVRIALSGRPKFGAYIEDPLNPLTASNKEPGKPAQEKKTQEKAPKEAKSEVREERKPRQERDGRKQERRENNRDRKSDERANRKQDRKQNGDRKPRQEQNDRKQDRRDNREVKAAEPTKPVLNTVQVSEQPKDDKPQSFEIRSKTESVAVEPKTEHQEVKPKTRIVESVLEFHEERVPDKRLGVGREKLEQKGRNGFIKQEVDENGNVIRVLAHELPRDQIIRYSARKPEDSEVTSESAEAQTIELETPSEAPTFTSAPEVPSFVNADEPEVPNFVTDTAAESNEAPVNFISEAPTFSEAPNFMSAAPEAAPVPNFITDSPKPTPGGFTPEELGITPELENPGFKADGGGITLNFIEP